MKQFVLLITVAFLGLSSTTALAEGPRDKARKDKLYKILTGLKVKSETIEPKKYEVKVPAAAVGSRGDEIRSGDRFVVLWPDSKISPLGALAKNIRNASEQGKSWSSLQLQLLDFKESFPEYKNEPLLKDLDVLLNQAM